MQTDSLYSSWISSNLNNINTVFYEHFITKYLKIIKSTNQLSNKFTIN